jgi:hypothetical protein
LAQILGYNPNELSTCPRSVWLFLNTDEPGSQSPVTQKNRPVSGMIAAWLDETREPRSADHRRADHYQLTIDEIKQRIACWLRYREFNLGLAELISYSAGLTGGVEIPHYRALHNIAWSMS